MSKRMTQMKTVLALMGGTHTLEDIVALIQEGHMQGHVVNDDTWAVTQVLQFPRKRVLEVFSVVGKQDDFNELHARILEFAQAIECDLIRAYGRHGWLPHAEAHGWTNGLRVYVKEAS